jgi:Alpha/beta hydrolase family
MRAIPFRNRNAPAPRADEAFCHFCSPAKHRAPNHPKLAQRARFHLRNASLQRFGGLQTFEPSCGGRGTILLVHGWGAEASFLAAFAEVLRRAGFRVFAFDFPAHGRSGGKYTNLAACARATHRIAELFAPVEGVVAHSIGGLAALWIAEGGPPLPSPVSIRKIALLACPNRFADVTRKFGAGLGLCRAGQHGFDMRLSRVGRRPVGSFSAANLLRHTGCEVLVVHGTGDDQVQFTDALAIVAASPRARLTACQSLGHAKLLYDPAVIRHVASFICGK